jgi:hypothetical protein
MYNSLTTKNGEDQQSPQVIVKPRVKEEWDLVAQLAAKDGFKRPREDETVISLDDDLAIEDEIAANKTKQAKLSSFLTTKDSSPIKKQNLAPMFLSPRVNSHNKADSPSAKNKSPVPASPRLVNRTSPFSMREKFSMFQNQIGNAAAANTSVNSSFAERVDLHMCERVATPPPVQQSKKPPAHDSPSTSPQKQPTSREEIVRKNPTNLYEHLKVLGLANDTQTSDSLLSQSSSSTNDKHNLSGKF